MGVLDEALAEVDESAPAKGAGGSVLDQALAEVPDKPVRRARGAGLLEAVPKMFEGLTPPDAIPEPPPAAPGPTVQPTGVLEAGARSLAAPTPATPGIPSVPEMNAAPLAPGVQPRARSLGQLGGEPLRGTLRPTAPPEAATRGGEVLEPPAGPAPPLMTKPLLDPSRAAALAHGLETSPAGTAARMAAAAAPKGTPFFPRGGPRTRDRQQIPPTQMVDPDTVDQTIAGLGGFIADLPVLMTGGGAGATAARNTVSWALDKYLAKLAAEGAVVSRGEMIRASHWLIRAVHAYYAAAQGAGALGLEGAVREAVSQLAGEAEFQQPPKRGGPSAAGPEVEPTGEAGVQQRALKQVGRGLDAEAQALTQQKQELEQARATLGAAPTREAVEAFNQQVDAYNARAQALGARGKFLPEAVQRYEAAFAEPPRAGMEPGRIVTAGAKGAALGGLTFGLSSQVPPGVLRTLTEAGVFGAAGPPIMEGRMPTVEDLLQSGVQIAAISTAFRLAKMVPERQVKDLIDSETPRRVVGAGESPRSAAQTAAEAARATAPSPAARAAEPAAPAPAAEPPAPPKPRPTEGQRVVRTTEGIGGLPVHELGQVVRTGAGTFGVQITDTEAAVTGKKAKPKTVPLDDSWSAVAPVAAPRAEPTTPPAAAPAPAPVLDEALAEVPEPTVPPAAPAPAPVPQPKSYDPEEAQKTYRQFKQRLTKALNAKDWQAVLREAEAFEQHYENSPEPYPDDWSRWQRAKDDAEFELRRQGQTPTAVRGGQPPAAVAPVPEPAEPPATQPGAFRLPQELAGAKPRYGVADHNYELDFASDLDKALYILAQTKPSSRDADYLSAVRAHTGQNDSKIRELGREVRAHVARTINTSGVRRQGVVRIPDSGIGARKPAATAETKPETKPAPPPVSAPAAEVPPETPPETTGRAPAEVPTLRPDIQQQLEALPPTPAGMVRVYRGEGTGEKALPAWVDEARKALDLKDVEGRWFTQDPAIAQWYVDDAGTGRMTWVDVPQAVADAHRVSRIGKPEVQRYSRDPENEFFLPKEWADKRKPIEGVATTSAPSPAPAAAPAPSGGAEGPFKTWDDLVRTAEPADDSFFNEGSAATVGGRWQVRRVDPDGTVYVVRSGSMMSFKVGQPPLKGFRRAEAAEPGKPPDFFATLPEDARETLFAYMRELDQQAERLEAQSRDLMGPAGTVPAGAAFFDPFIQSLARSAYVRALRRGRTPDAALELARKELRDAVQQHNAKRPKDVAWPRDKDFGSDTAMTVHRRVLDITGPAPATAPPAPAPAPTTVEPKTITQMELPPLATMKSAAEGSVLRVVYTDEREHVWSKAKGDKWRLTTSSWQNSASLATLLKREVEAGRIVSVEYTPERGEVPTEAPPPPPLAEPAQPAGTYEHAERFGKLVTAFTDKLRDNSMPTDPREVRKLASQITGVPARAFTADQAAIDDIYDALEVAVNRLYHNARSEASPLAQRLGVALGWEKALGNRTRTIDITKRQQFSTPLPIAEASAWALDVKPGELVYEPTAGTGNLLAPLTRGTPVLANEIDPRRVEALRLQGYRPTSGDALRITLATTPQVVVMNPPWGKYSTQRYGKPVPQPYGDPVDIAERFVVKALRDLAPGGRVVAVLPTTILEAPKFLEWLRANHTMRALIQSPPGAYDTRSTTVDSVILAVDKGKVDGAPAELRGTASDWDDLARLVGPLSAGGTHARVAPAVGPAGGAQPPREPRPAVGPTPVREPGPQRPVPGPAQPGGPAPVAGGQPGREPQAGVPGVGGGAGAGAREPGAGVVAVGGGEPAPEPAGTDRGLRGESGGGTEFEHAAEPEWVGESEGQHYSVASHEELDAALRSPIFAPAPLRRAPGLNPHPRLLVKTRSLAGAKLPVLAYEPKGAMLWDAYQRKVISDGQIDYGILPALQAAARGHGFLVAADVGVGKTRIGAGVIAEWLETGGAKRVLYVTASEVNVQDVLGEFNLYAGGKWPWEILPVRTFKGAAERGKKQDIEPLPLKDKAVYIIDRYNLAAYRRALEGVAFDAIVGDEAHLLKNAEAAVGQAWMSLQTRALANQGKFVYMTATPATELGDLEQFVGLREWVPGGFEDWVQAATGSNPEALGNISALVERLAQLRTQWQDVRSVDQAEKDRVLAELPPTDALNWSVAHERRVANYQQAIDRLRNAIFEATKNLPPEAGGPQGTAVTVGQDPEHLGVVKKSKSFFKGRDAFSVHVTPAEQEQIMRELAMKGKYDSVDLWRAGVEFEVVTQAPTPEQLAELDTLSGFFHDLNAAFFRFGRMNKHKKNFTIRHFLQQEAKRRMFDYRLGPAIENAAKALARGEQPVISVINVSEQTEEEGPIPAAINAINDRLVEVDNETGEVISDEEIPEALVVRAELLERWAAVRPMESPVERVLAQFGKENVAVVTGSESPKMRQKMIADFQAGQRRVALISGAGKTGISLHHVLELPEAQPAKGRRRLIVADYEWSATTFKQELGRVDRSGQVSAPAVDAHSTGAAGEKKFLATIANRMRNLGALSKGSAESASNDKISEFEIGGDLDTHAMREGYRTLSPDVQDEFMARSFRDSNTPERNTRSFPSGASLKDFLLDLQFMPPAAADTAFEAFWRERTQLIAEQEEAEEERKGRTRTYQGSITASHVIRPELTLHEVKDSAGHSFGILHGIVTPHLVTIAKHLERSKRTGTPVRRYVTFRTPDRQIAGLEIRKGSIARVLQTFGQKAKKRSLETPADVAEALKAGDRVPLTGGPGGYVLRRRPSDERFQVEGAKIAERDALLKNGATYAPVGNYFFVPPENLERFLARYPVRVQADDPEPEPPDEASMMRTTRAMDAEPGPGPRDEPDGVDPEAAVAFMRTILGEPAPTFYSKLEQAVAERMPQRALPAQVMAAVRAAGVKDDELKWTGFDDWLKGLEGRKVSKDEALEFLRANRVEVVDDLRGASEKSSEAHRAFIAGFEAADAIGDEALTTLLGADAYNLFIDNFTESAVYNEGIEYGAVPTVEVSKHRDYPGYLIVGAPGYWIVFAEDDAGVMGHLRGPFTDLESATEAAWEDLTGEDNEERGALGATQYSQYTLPGGQNYRELLLTWKPPETGKPTPLTELPAGYEPISDSSQTPERRWGVTPPGQVSARVMGGRHPTKEAALAEALTLVNNERLAAWATERDKGVYRAPHFNQAKNVLAHVRFTEWTDAQDRRWLLLEEVQSDWHERGRRLGYRGPVPEPPPLELIQNADYSWRMHMPGVGPGRNLEGTIVRWQGSGYEESRRPFPEGGRGYRASFQNESYEFDDFETAKKWLSQTMQPAQLRVAGYEQLGKLPDAPFKKTWHELALRRMLRWAAEHGFDGMAWTTGAQQAERYDLRKVVDRISAFRRADGLIDLMVYPKGERGYHDITGLTAEKLMDTVGKDLAEQIMAQPQEPRRSTFPQGPAEARVAGGGWKNYQGLDLAVGGEGMLGFYDKILPDYLRRYAKKWGATVGEVKLPRYALGKLTTQERSELRADAKALLNATIDAAEFNARWGTALTDNDVPEADPARHTQFVAQIVNLAADQVKTSTARATKRTMTVHGLPVTPAMKASVMQEGQPLFMRRQEGREERAAAALDPRAIKVLAGNLYKGNLGAVAAKELVGNFADALYQLADPSTGRGEIRVDTKLGEMTAQDNGVGMTPEVAGQEFVDIGGSRSQTQGFGIAKVALFANAEDIRVRTTAATPKGRFTTILTGTGADWSNPGVGLRMETRPATEGEVGTELTVRYPKSKMDRWAITDQLAAMKSFARTPFTIDALIDGQPVQPHKAAEGVGEIRQVSEVKVKGARIVFHASTGEDVSDVPWTWVLNHGVPQFDVTTKVKTKMRLPKVLLADVHADAGPESPDYPFSANREELRSKAVDEAIKTFVRSWATQAATREMLTYQKGLAEAPEIEGTGGLTMVDTTGRLPKELVGELAVSPQARWFAEQAGRAFDVVKTLLAAGDLAPLFEKVRFHGIGLGGEYLGVNLTGTGIYGPGAGNIILLNPYTMVLELQHDLERGRVPEVGEGFAGSVVATILHELTHEQDKGHQEKYAGALTRAMGHVMRELPRAMGGLIIKGADYEQLLRDANRLVPHYGKGPGVFGPVVSELAAPRQPEDGERAARGGGPGAAGPAAPVRGGGGGAPEVVAPGPELGVREAERISADALRSADYQLVQHPDGRTFTGDADAQTLARALSGRALDVRVQRVSGLLRAVWAKASVGAPPPAAGGAGAPPAAPPPPAPPGPGPEPGSEPPEGLPPGTEGRPTLHTEGDRRAFFEDEANRIAEEIRAAGDEAEVRRAPGRVGRFSVTRRARAIGASVRTFLAPATVSRTAQEAAGLMRERTAELARKTEVARYALRQAAHAMDELPLEQRYAFIDFIEQGRIDALPAEFREVGQALREALDGRREEVRALDVGALESFIQDYFPHIWLRGAQDPAAVAGKFMGKRPLEGSKSFLKKRTIPTTRDGLGYGLEPVSTNPITLALLKIREMDRFLMGQQIAQEAIEAERWVFVRGLKPPPPGYAEIDDRLTRRWQWDAEHGGFIRRGTYYAPEDEARIVNNYLKPGLQGNALFDAYRGLGNLLNSVQLGFSAFHAGFVTMDTAISGVALGLQQISTLEAKQALHGVGRIALATGSPLAAAAAGFALAGPVGLAAGGVVGALVSPIRTVIQGSRALREYYAPGSQGEAMANLVDGLVRAGGRARMERFYTSWNSLEKFGEGWRQGDLATMARHGLPAITEAIMWPVMEWLVPRMKAGVFLEMARFELERLPATATEDEVRRVLGTAWDSVDNRLGQIVYDNLFWSRRFKDLLLVTFRSTGWNLGTLREGLGGSVRDLPLMLGHEARAIHARLYGESEAQRGERQRERRFSSGTTARLPRRTAYILAAVLANAVASILYQYGMTGEEPSEWLDFFFPWNGRYNRDGSKQRASFPTYIKDAFAWGTQPLTTLAHKLHPLNQLVYDELWSNRDHRGGYVRDPDHPAMQQLWESVKYGLGTYQPYALGNFDRQMQQGASAGEAAQSFVGVTPAPAYITRSAAQRRQFERRQEKHPPDPRKLKERREAESILP